MPNKALPQLNDSNWGTPLNNYLTQLTDNVNGGGINKFEQFSQRPTNLTLDDKGKTYLYTQTGNIHQWNGTVWKVLNESVINVKDYGAVGDGVTDDTAAIQNVLNQISLVRPSLFFPSGRYKVTSPLNLTSQGSGTGGIYHGEGYSSTIEYYPPISSNSIADGFGGFIKSGVFNFGNDNEYANFRDLRFVLVGITTNNACAIKGYNYYKGTIENLIIEGFECGINLSNSWSNVIRNCKIKNCNYGIILQLQQLLKMIFIIAILQYILVGICSVLILQSQFYLHKDLQ
jgi:Pectate lyase superfamily protein